MVRGMLFGDIKNQRGHAYPNLAEGLFVFIPKACCCDGIGVLMGMFSKMI